MSFDSKIEYFHSLQSLGTRQVFYRSLMAENHSRLQHLDGAIKHLDDEMINLHRKSQIYRQEEITEEIEVILLNAESEFMR